jgi:PAS domain S-box-containing protein
MDKGSFSENINKTFLTNSSIPVILTDDKLNIINLNETAKKIIGSSDLNKIFIEITNSNSSHYTINNEIYKISEIANIDKIVRIFILEKLMNQLNGDIYKIMVENADNAISIHDLNFKRIYSNDALNKLYGYNRDEYSKLPPFFNIAPEDIEKIKSKEIMNELLQNKKYHIKYRAQHKNGEWLYINSKAVLIEDHINDERKILTITQDNTSFVRSEIKLKESEEKYRFLVEHSNDATYIFSNKTSNFMYLSPNIEKITGYEVENFYNDSKFYLKILTSESRRYIEEINLQTTISKKLIPTLNFEIIDKNGKRKYIEQKVLPYKDANNNVIGSHGVFSDISEKRNIENALKESEERFRHLGTLLPQIIFECNVNAIIIFMNDEGLRQFQISKEDFIRGTKTFDLIDSEYVDQAKEIFQERLAGKFGGIELKLKRKDGTNFYGLSYSNSAILNGETIIRGIIVDITQNKINEAEKVELLNKLNLLNETKDKFFSIISHDLRDPFNSLLGLTELLIENFDEMDEIEKKDYLYHLHSTSKTTFNLLQNLLDWSKTQSGKIPIVKQKINLYEKVNEIVENTNISISKKNIRVNLEISSDLSVFADNNMLNSIISNLLNNAIKFSKKDSEINISAQYIDNKAEIHIADFGIGISQPVLDKIFNSEIFFSTRGTNNEKGSGLGLLLCKEFIEKNDGNIYIRSQPDYGTTVIFTLPASNF